MSDLLKMIPGEGSGVGGIVAVTAVVGLTTAFGEAYLAALGTLFTQNKDEPPTADEVAKALKAKYLQLADGS